MEVKLKAGDSLNIPEGCKAIIKDNQIIIEQKIDRNFKDGDILKSKLTNNIVIFRFYIDKDKSTFKAYYNSSDSSNSDWNTFCFRYATEKEKQDFFDDLKAKGLRWNAEEKKVEKIRWRAGAEETYYFITSSVDVLKIDECCSARCNEQYSAGNYFRTKEQAEKAANRVKETLRKFHEEIGE